MTVLMTTTGRMSLIQREHLQKQIDADRVKPPLEGKAFAKARAAAKVAGTLGEFYDQAHLSQLHGFVQPGDEVWAYSTIDVLSGSAGYCVIREDVIVASMTVLMS